MAAYRDLSDSSDDEEWLKRLQAPPVRVAKKKPLRLPDSDSSDSDSDDDSILGDAMKKLMISNTAPRISQSYSTDSDDDSSASEVTPKKSKSTRVVAADDSETSAWMIDEGTSEAFLCHENLSDLSFPRFRIPTDLFNQLYAHQKDGVQWMATLHNGKIGGILGDDMGTYIFNQLS